MRIALVTTTLLSATTPLLAYAATGFSEPGVGLMVALALIALDALDRGQSWAPVGVGVAIGAAGLFRTDSWWLVGVPVLVALWTLSTKKWPAIAIGVSPFLVVWAAYNDARFGSPTARGYSLQTFSHPLWSGLYGLALSPGRGIFICVPILLVALAALPLSHGANRVFGWLALAMLVLRLLFYARWWSWYGGDTWGPRFMLQVIPAFSVLIATALTRCRKPIVLVAIIVTVSIGAALTVNGLETIKGHTNLTYSQPRVDVKLFFVPKVRGPGGRAAALMRHWTSPKVVQATDHVMFDWSRFPYIGSWL